MGKAMTPGKPATLGIISRAKSSVDFFRWSQGKAPKNTAPCATVGLPTTAKNLSNSLYLRPIFSSMFTYLAVYSRVAPSGPLMTIKITPRSSIGESSLLAALSNCHEPPAAANMMATTNQRLENCTRPNCQEVKVQRRKRL